MDNSLSIKDINELLEKNSSLEMENEYLNEKIASTDRRIQDLEDIVDQIVKLVNESDNQDLIVAVSELTGDMDD